MRLTTIDMKTLNEIQKTLKAPKGQQNTFGNYRYRSCEDIVEAVKPLLGESTLTISDEIVLIGDRYYVKATATIREGEESASVSAFARESFEKKGMDAAQITGATSSYARKYALNGLFAIDDTKDPDTMDNTKTPVSNKNSVTVPNLSAQDTCMDCGSIKVMRKDGTGSYCKNKYPITNPSCPKKPLIENDQRIADELDNIPRI